jgi:asparagine N-glycosylation enzyme membrane subunit Stt3
LKFKSAGHAFFTSWPNVYTTVAELSNASIQSVIATVGTVFFWMAVIGILLMFILKENRRERIIYGALATLWLIGAAYASTKGVRFTLLMVPPIGIGVASFLSFVWDKSIYYLQKFSIKPIITKVMLIIILSLLFVPYISQQAEYTKQDIPMINDVWFGVLDKVRTDSEPNAIINSWWDFGHHFKYLADRAVTFDGASQNTPMAHWIGKVLSTSDEELAVGVLRMLDCGSNNAYNLLDKEINDASVSVNVLDYIVKLDKSSAEKYLKEKKIQNIEGILANTHCNPPEDYFITSGDMIAKAGVWAHFGLWDFNKADVWISVKNGSSKKDIVSEMQTKLGYTKSKAEEAYYQLSTSNEDEANNWISPWPGYANVDCSKQGTIMNCGGIIVDTISMTAGAQTDKGYQSPTSIIYTKDNITQLKNLNGTLGQSMLLFDNSALIVSDNLVNSVFTRLFFYNGNGLHHFVKFAEGMQPTGENVIIWRIKW